MLTWKNPSPCSATSSELPVACSAPGTNSWLMSASWVPSPMPTRRTSRPPGPTGAVSPAWYPTSVECATARLKPVELTLARLFDTTSSWRWLASMPVTEMRCETSMVLCPTHVVDGLLERGVLHLQQLLVRLVGAHQVHRRHHRLRHVYVRAFEVALVELHADRGLGQCAIRCGEHAVADFVERYAGWEVD